MGTRTRTTLDSARAKELAANRPAASQRRNVDYRALALRRWQKYMKAVAADVNQKFPIDGGQNGTE